MRFSSRRPRTFKAGGGPGARSDGRDGQRALEGGTGHPRGAARWARLLRSARLSEKSLCAEASAARGPGVFRGSLRGSRECPQEFPRATGASDGPGQADLLQREDAEQGRPRGQEVGGEVPGPASSVLSSGVAQDALNSPSREPRRRCAVVSSRDA
ncbi:unnamed protein product [Rangifer tarandus platyrhynchus]|uniref:Uncharacterized protein n=2 Tax=Rangifer tarandus platyrhynchus TaxID=3082113 RepID=A0ABN8YL25_RANTA|nr:unnamed protein product [Rangifer tarandus platyrhynchus]CAI9696856.1 unnamed protein product [Rangifer tarandus platyrhynchus]